jgi:hypothetical protein
MTDATAGPRSPLEEQLTTLVALGVRLAAEVSPADIRAAADPVELEQQPYVHLLSVLAAEPPLPGEPFVPGMATNVGWFDLEFVDAPDAYSAPIRFLAAVTGRADRLTELDSAIDLEAAEGAVSYRLDGDPRSWEVEVRDDWADTMVLSYVLDDLVSPQADAATFSDGQRFGFVVVDPAQREPLQQLLDTWTDS